MNRKEKIEELKLEKETLLANAFSFGVNIPKEDFVKLMEEAEEKAKLIDEEIRSLIKKEIEKVYHDESWESLDLDNPKFEEANKVHDWRNYVPDVVADQWEYLSEETKKVVFIMADAQAQNEEWE
mgnify:CR=1 FL=1